MIFSTWVWVGEANEEVGITLQRQKLDSQVLEKNHVGVSLWTDLMSDELTVLNDVLVSFLKINVSWIKELILDSHAEDLCLTVILV